MKYLKQLSIFSLIIALPVFGFCATDLVKENMNAKAKDMNCPTTMQKANEEGWQVLPGFSQPDIPLQYVSGPKSGYGYHYVCMYKSSSSPFGLTGLYHQ